MWPRLDESLLSLQGRLRLSVNSAVSRPRQDALSPDRGYAIRLLANEVRQDEIMHVLKRPIARPPRPAAGLRIAGDKAKGTTFPLLRCWRLQSTREQLFK